MPLDPREVRVRTPRHFVTGSINGAPFEGSRASRGGAVFVVLNAAFRAAAGIEPGDQVDVVLAPRD